MTGVPKRLTLKERFEEKQREGLRRKLSDPEYREEALRRWQHHDEECLAAANQIMQQLMSAGRTHQEVLGITAFLGAMAVQLSPGDIGETVEFLKAEVLLYAADMDDDDGLEEEAEK